MSKTLLVLRNELRRAIFRRSFILVLFVLPLVSAIVFMGVSYVKERDAASQATGSGGTKTLVEGYVDFSGVIKTLPDQAAGVLKPFDSKAEAQTALADGEISAFYIVPPDYLQTGQISYYRPDFNPLSQATQSSEFRYTLTYNLVNQDPQLADRIQNPLNNLVREVQTGGQPQRDSNAMLTFFLPYAVTFLFYIVIFSSASLMLNSITDEKQNRVMEVLMTSMTPIQMLTGKIIALGIVGLMQTVIWSGTGYVLLRLSKQTFNVSDAFQLPPTILIWGVIFFVLGYAVYASLMAGVGALVPNLREASQATMIIILPLILPLMLIQLLANQPEGPVAVALSLFPLTAPVAMMARLAAGVVPLWQLLLAVALLAIMALLVLRSAAGMFRAQNLLSGQSFNMKLFFRALTGKA